jgi:serine/threonine protein kinase/tetratricopeptide (TPR) repeat protein
MIGTKLGPYEILEPIGKGGMGEIYRAKDSRLGRDVAIKVLPEQLAKDAEALARFERETRALASLSHPNILSIYDVGGEQGILFAVTELLEGETLRSRLEREPLTLEDFLQINLSIASALSAAHSKGVVHRDLKPDNIFLTRDHHLKILDFGLALQDAISVADGSHPKSSSDTEPGMIVGSVDYMSPEQVRGETADSRSDIFSLGSVMFEMISGRAPFSRATLVDTLAAVLREEPARVPAGDRNFPQELNGIVLRCLKKNPTERFQSSAEIRTALMNLSTATTRISVKTRLHIPRIVWIVLISLLLAVFAVVLYRSSHPAEQIHTIAILPFSNASNNPDAEFISDGVTESIIRDLSEISKIRVMASSTVFRYKKTKLDPQTIGTRLKADAVVTGKVLIRNEILIIKAELVNVRTGALLWGDEYSRKLSDIFRVQDEIAKKISGGLRLKLSTEQEKRISKKDTENVEAYESYLKGRYYWNKRNEEALKKGIDYFQRAVETDPQYALAYAGLADSYNLLSLYGGLNPMETFPKAKSAAVRALQIDETLPEAHTSLAYVHLYYDWDWSGAEKEFQRALELNPNYATAHVWYGEYLQALARFEESIQEMKRAQALDPLSLIVQADLGWTYFRARRYDQAIEEFNRALELDPDFLPALSGLGWAYALQNNIPKSSEHFQKAKSISSIPSFPAGLAYLYAISGNKKEAIKTVADPEMHLSAYNKATIYAGLKQNEIAFEFLDKAFAEKSDSLVFLKVEPTLDGLHGDPRFDELIRRMGLPSK